MSKVTPTGGDAAHSTERKYIVSVPSDLALGPGVREILAKIDSDGDGVLTLPELLSVVKDKESAEAEASRLRTYLLVGALLYLLTLASIFGISLGASSLLKDAYTSGGVKTAADGSSLATPTSFYAGEALLSDLLEASEEQIDALTELDFTTPMGQMVRMPVAFVLATPTEDGDSWEMLELFGQAGQSVVISEANVTLLVPSSDFRDAEAIDLTVEETDSEGRRLQQGNGGRRPPYGSFRMGPRQGSPYPEGAPRAPPNGRGGAGPQGGRGLQGRPNGNNGNNGGQGVPAGRPPAPGAEGGPGMPPCTGFCPAQGSAQGSPGFGPGGSSRSGGNGGQGGFGNQGGQGGFPNGMTGVQRGARGNGGGMGRPRF